MIKIYPEFWSCVRRDCDQLADCAGSSEDDVWWLCLRHFREKYHSVGPIVISPDGGVAAAVLPHSNQRTHLFFETIGEVSSQARHEAALRAVDAAQ